MRVDTRKRSHAIDIDDIVKNIKQKKFQVLRPRDKFIDKKFKKGLLIVAAWVAQFEFQYKH